MSVLLWKGFFSSRNAAALKIFFIETIIQLVKAKRLDDFKKWKITFILLI